MAQEGIVENSIAAIPGIAGAVGGGTLAIKEGNKPLVISVDWNVREQLSNLQMFLLTEITAKIRKMEHVKEGTMDPEAICVQ